MSRTRHTLLGLTVVLGVAVALVLACAFWTGRGAGLAAIASPYALAGAHAGPAVQVVGGPDANACTTYCGPRDDTPRLGNAAYQAQATEFIPDPLHTGRSEPLALRDRVPSENHVTPLVPPPVL